MIRFGGEPGLVIEVPASTPTEVPVNTVLPSITGTTEVGETLTCDPGEWENNPTIFSYYWKKCDEDGLSCSDLGVSDAPTCILPESALGSTIRCEVTAINGVGPSEPATSAPTEVVT